MSRYIPSYLEKILSKFQGLQETPDGWNAICPCPDHGEDGQDKSPSLGITIGEGGIILLRCRVGCQTSAVLESIELTFKELWPNPYSLEEPAKPLTSCEAPGLQGEEFQELCHKVYQALLNKLPLTKEHQKDLKSRGFTQYEMMFRGYVSLRGIDRLEVPGQLFEQFGEKLFQVPGFRQTSSGSVQLLPEVLGLIIPVLGLDRKIKALKIRRPDGEPKYLYISSAPGGRSPGSPVHCPSPSLGQTYERVRVTEGELKADVATSHSQIYTLGLPGVNSWSRIFPLLEQLGVKEVLVAFDWRDVRLKNPVAIQCLSFVSALLSHGYKVGIETWNPIYKGIDDALVSHQTITEHWDEVIKMLQDVPALSNKIKKKKGDWLPDPFPIEALPEPLRVFCCSIAKSLGCPVDFLAVPSLVVAGSMVGGVRKAQVQPGWDVQCNLYAAIVADPGSMKSPALKKVIHPCVKIQEEIDELYQQASYQHEQKLLIWKALDAAYKQELKNCAAAGLDIHGEHAPTSPGPKPSAPFQEHLYIDDVTTEKSMMILSESKKGVLQICDEVVSILRQFNAYRGGRGSDRQKYLSLWSGENFKIDRKGSKESLIVKDPFFSFLGGIQPDLLGSLEDANGREDGFVHRILFSMPKAEQLPPLTWASVPEEAQTIWELLVRALRAIGPDENGEALVLPLSPMAREKFNQWYENDHRQESKALSFPTCLMGPWSKLKEYVIRIALILHMLREAGVASGLVEVSEDPELCHEIDELDIDRAIQLIQYFKSHCRGVFYKMEFDRDEKLVNDFVKWLAGEGGVVAENDIWSKNNNWGLKSRSSARKFLEKVQDRGHGILTDDAALGKQGRPKKIFVLCSEEN